MGIYGKRRVGGNGGDFDACTYRLHMATMLAIIASMNNAQRKTLEAIFSMPTPRNLEWARMESLFVALGCVVIEGNGSRVRFELGGVVGTFHRPHPAKEAKPYQVRDAKLFLTEAGVTP